jgi:hypothetical protein
VGTATHKLKTIVVKTCAILIRVHFLSLCKQNLISFAFAFFLFVFFGPMEINLQINCLF